MRTVAKNGVVMLCVAVLGAGLLSPRLPAQQVSPGGPGLIQAGQPISQEPIPQEGETVPKKRTRHFIATSGVAVAVGDYGTGQDTTIAELFETLKYRGRIGEVGLTVPYLFRDGSGTTPGESRVVGGTGIPGQANGLGDIQLKGTYYWLEENTWRPGVDLTSRVKFPTASDAKGLGTGRFDVGVGTELTKWLGPLITLGDLELLLRDTPGGSTLNSTRLNYSVGAGYPLTHRFTPYVFLEGSTPSSSGAAAPLEVVMSGVYNFTETLSGNGYFLVGLTDGSPDFGVGTSVSVKF